MRRKAFKPKAKKEDPTKGGYIPTSRKALRRFLASREVPSPYPDGSPRVSGRSWRDDPRMLEALKAQKKKLRAAALRDAAAAVKEVGPEAIKEARRKSRNKRKATERKRRAS